MNALNNHKKAYSINKGKVSIVPVTKETVKRKRKLRPWVKTAMLCIGLSMFSMGIVSTMVVPEYEVEYQEVYIGEGGSAFGAIREMNAHMKVDVRELLVLFEDENDLNGSHDIHVGYYSVPVVISK